MARCTVCPDEATTTVYGFRVCEYHRVHGEDDSCARCGRGPVVGYIENRQVCALCVVEAVDRYARGRAPAWPGYVVGELEEQ